LAYFLSYIASTCRSGQIEAQGALSEAYLPAPTVEAGKISDFLVNGKNWFQGIVTVER